MKSKEVGPKRRCSVVQDRHIQQPLQRLWCRLTCRLPLPLAFNVASMKVQEAPRSKKDDSAECRGRTGRMSGRCPMASVQMAFYLLKS
jgi:hypothetical protein